MILVIGVRFSYRFLRYLKKAGEQKFSGKKNLKNVMIIGAGEAGRTIIKEMVDIYLYERPATPEVKEEATPVCDANTTTDKEESENLGGN